MAQPPFQSMVLNLDEVKDFQDMIFCQICFELNLPDKKPLFCVTCQTIAFCSICYKKCMEKDKKCPFCRTVSPQIKYIEDSSFSKKLLSQVKLSCEFYSLGCDEALLFYEVSNHLKECGNCKYCSQQIIKRKMKEHFSMCPSYPRQCPFCDVIRTKYQLQYEHFCLPMLYKNDKEKKAHQITANRFKVPNSTKQLLDSVRCYDCKNIVRKPKECMNCLKCFCSLCTDKFDQVCNQCWKGNTLDESIEEYLKNILDQVEIKCQHCKKWQNYWQIDQHELKCRKCQFCNSSKRETDTIMEHILNECPNALIYCIQCNQSHTRSIFTAHDCNQQIKEQIEKGKIEAQLEISRERGVARCFKNAFMKDQFTMNLYLLMVLPIILGDHICQLLTYQLYSNNGYGNILIAVGIMIDIFVTIVFRLNWLRKYAVQGKDNDSLLLQDENKSQNKMTFPKAVVSFLISLFFPYSEGIIHNGLFKIKDSGRLISQMILQRAITSYIRTLMVFLCIMQTQKVGYEPYEIYNFTFGVFHLLIVCFWTYSSSSKKHEGDAEL